MIQCAFLLHVHTGALNTEVPRHKPGCILSINSTHKKGFKYILLINSIFLTGFPINLTFVAILS